MSFSLAGVPVKALVDFVDFNGLIHLDFTTKITRFSELSK